LISEDIDDIKVAVTAIAYYLYRQLACRYGDNFAGFTAWLEMQRDAFEKLADPTGEDDEITE
jgi:hypothetical protein